MDIIYTSGNKKKPKNDMLVDMNIVSFVFQNGCVLAFGIMTTIILEVVMPNRIHILDNMKPSNPIIGKVAL